MKKELNVTKTSEPKKGKKSIGIRIFHWAILIYLCVAIIGLCYGGMLFVDFIVTAIKSWV